MQALTTIQVKSDCSPRSVAITARVRALTMGAIACGLIVTGAETAKAQDPEVVNTAYLMALTGPAAAFGRVVQQGALLAEQAVNEQGGIKSLGGAKLKVEIVDHQSKQDIAFTRTRDLARRSEIPFVIGAASSGATITATEAAERLELPFLVDGSNDDQITSRGFEYLVNLSMPMSQAAYNSMKGLRELSDKYGWGLENIAILIHDDPPGPVALEGVEAAVGEFGFNVIETFPYAESTTDFSPVIAQLKALQPDLTIQQSYPASALLLTKTMAEMDYNPPAIFGIQAGHMLNIYREELGDNANGTIFTSYWAPDLNFPGAEDFSRRWREAGYGETPDLFAAFGYRTVIAAYHILEEAGSIDREVVLETMKNLDIEEGDWPLYPFIGGIKFNESGENIRDEVVIAEWIDGKPRSIWPFHVAGAEPVWPKPDWK